jgi:hypothetical protein
MPKLRENIMNDFTKEELMWISEQLEHITQDYSYVDKEAYSIQEKVQSMIDNYENLLIPKMADYVCNRCNEEWKDCECKK